MENDEAEAFFFLNMTLISKQARRETDSRTTFVECFTVTGSSALTE